jgi:DNA modification methylase
MKPESDIELFHGDCFTLIPEAIEPGSIDLILSDPPYGIFGDRRMGITFDETVNWKLFEETADQIIKPNGQILLFGNFDLLMTLRITFRKWYPFFHHIIIKSQAMPTNQYYPLNDVEYLAVFRKGRISEATFNPKETRRTGETYRKKNYIREVSTRKMTKSEITENTDGSRWICTTLEMKSKPNLPADERTAHPFQKDIELLRELVRVYSNSGELILDPFCGSGSTLIAAHLENRQAIGIEKDSKWYEVAAKRIEQATAQLSIF